jgi:site-specific DNA recombinase
MKMKTETQPAKTIRCAIYTRKSTEEGLQQEFNSLDAQREAAEAFIASQKTEGWRCLPEAYDDGGFSGGTLDRPAMKRLMEDIEAGKVDCVVVYKVDRLSRSLMDFSRVMETFDKFGVSFVSVTQHFNTTHSMGRLTLNILLSFPQFEREIIGERIRDKLAAMRSKGKSSGGIPVLGYDVDRSGPSPKLVVNATKAKQVCQIFSSYLELRSLLPVVKKLEKIGRETCRMTIRSALAAYRSVRCRHGLTQSISRPLKTSPIPKCSQVTPILSPFAFQFPLVNLLVVERSSLTRHRLSQPVPESNQIAFSDPSS